MEKPWAKIAAGCVEDLQYEMEILKFVHGDASAREHLVDPIRVDKAIRKLLLEGEVSLREGVLPKP